VDPVFKTLIEVATVVIALSFFIQAIAFLLIYARMKKLTSVATAMQAKAEPLIEKAGPVIDQVQTTVVTVRGAVDKISLQAKDTFEKVSLESRAVAAAVSASSQEIAHLARQQAQQISATIDHTTSTLQRQVSELDRLLSRTNHRIEETTIEVQATVLEPVREISALLIGLKRTLDALFGRERKQIDKAYQDEEMFI
jgi:hypothetical protein